MSTRSALGLALGIAALGLGACYIDNGVYSCFDDYDCPGGTVCGYDGVCYEPAPTALGCYDDYDCAAG